MLLILFCIMEHPLPISIQTQHIHSLLCNECNSAPYLYVYSLFNINNVCPFGSITTSQELSFFYLFYFLSLVIMFCCSLKSVYFCVYTVWFCTLVQSMNILYSWYISMLKISIIITESSKENAKSRFKGRLLVILYCFSEHYLCK